MNNVVLSTKNIDDFIDQISDEVVRKIQALSPFGDQSPSDQVFDIVQAAKFLNISVPAIRAKVFRRDIPHTKDGKRVFFLRSILIEWLKESTKQTSAFTSKQREQEANDFISNRKNKVAK